MDKDREYKDEFAKKVAIAVSTMFSRGETRVLGRTVEDEDGKFLVFQIFVAGLISDPAKSSRILTLLAKFSESLGAKVRISVRNRMICVD